MAGILKTTSRLESENSFFGNYLNKNISLVELWMRFDSALKAQRHKELLADNDTLHSIPELKMHVDLEKHGRDIYTLVCFTFLLSNMCSPFPLYLLSTPQSHFYCQAEEKSGVK